MKRIGNLYEKIISVENLNLADSKARKGKRASYGVRWHDKNKESNIEKLHGMLKNKTFKTSMYNVFKIYEPKEREIYRLPYFPDRIVHHAVMNILEPIWVSIFTSNTYSCIKGRGIHACVRDVKKALNDVENTTYCLKLDIKKYYPSVDGGIMKTIVRKKIKCKETLWLIDEIIDSAKGLPIGNYLSQYLANLYLAYFDHWIKEDMRVRYYFRYADDIVVLSGDKEGLHRLTSEIGNYFQRHLKLMLKENYQVFPVSKRGIDFVGYVFYGTHTKMRKSIKKNMCRKIHRLKKKCLTEKYFKMQIASHLGWAKHCNSINLLNKVYYDKSNL